LKEEAWNVGHGSSGITVLAVRDEAHTEPGYLCGCISYGQHRQTTCDIAYHSILTLDEAKAKLIALANEYLLT
jgi:hypothetical protein